MQGTGWDCDQGVMQVDLHSEGKGDREGIGEANSIHESEYGPKDEEDGENRDKEGVQEGE
ncbi:UNVERIFIED_CONTAM: hypothetical protein Sangu_2890000 [Sesamum angustifolium]|uniref:Uncharacterized protein n=1 Tax=Sesamum angustifolium TaxID=2727405 RepID=A0AAW2IMV6_9LAMI